MLRVLRALPSSRLPWASSQRCVAALDHPPTQSVRGTQSPINRPHRAPRVTSKARATRRASRSLSTRSRGASRAPATPPAPAAFRIERRLRRPVVLPVSDVDEFTAFDDIVFLLCDDEASPTFQEDYGELVEGLAVTRPPLSAPHRKSLGQRSDRRATAERPQSDSATADLTVPTARRQSGTGIP